MCRKAVWGGVVLFFLNALVNLCGMGSIDQEAITINLPNLPVGARALRLVRVRAGNFEMGSNDEPAWSWCHPCEQPVHEVSINYDYYIGETPITQAQWEAVMGTNPSKFIKCGQDGPVDSVSWNCCQQFLNALNELEQGVFRLPSEPEWEYAFRAGTTTRFYFGDIDCLPTADPSGEFSQHAWWQGNTQKSTKRVAVKGMNPWGIYDMCGNVWEWCEDDWHDGYLGAPTDGTAWVEFPRADRRVLRGGSWLNKPLFSRSSARVGHYPRLGTTNYGVRVVCAVSVSD